MWFRAGQKNKKIKNTSAAVRQGGGRNTTKYAKRAPPSTAQVLKRHTQKPHRRPAFAKPSWRPSPHPISLPPCLPPLLPPPLLPAPAFLSAPYSPPCPPLPLSLSPAPSLPLSFWLLFPLRSSDPLLFLLFPPLPRPPPPFPSLSLPLLMISFVATDSTISLGKRNCLRHCFSGTNRENP